MSARGKLKERLWRLSDGTMATIDDISVFVVPMLPYREEHLLWKVSAQTSAVAAVEYGTFCQWTLSGSHPHIV